MGFLLDLIELMNDMRIKIIFQYILQSKQDFKSSKSSDNKRNLFSTHKIINFMLSDLKKINFGRFKYLLARRLNVNE